MFSSYYLTNAQYKFISYTCSLVLSIQVFEGQSLYQHWHGRPKVNVFIYLSSYTQTWKIRKIDLRIK